MSKEFKKWIDSEIPKGEIPVIADVENAWNAARDKILEILKENIQTYDSGRGPNFDWRFIDENVIKQIEKV